MAEPEPEEPKAKSKSVSFLPDLWEKVEAKAAAEFAGNRSSYLRELVEADLAGNNGGELSPTILVDLVRRLLGELDAGHAAMSLEGKDQRLKLKRMLERMLHEEFDLDLHAAEVINAPGEDPEKQLDEVARQAGENFRNYYQSRRLGKAPALREIPGNAPAVRKRTPLNPEYSGGRSSADKTKPASAQPRGKPREEKTGTHE